MKEYGTVIEAMGTINGVTTSRVTAGKWTHWGELAGVGYINANNEELTMNNEQLQGDGSPSASRQTLRKGSKGEAVKELQAMLDKLGYDLGSCGIDGDFGKATETAVRSFQSDHRLAVDGIVGILTWTELRNEELKMKNEESGKDSSSGIILTEAEGSHITYCVTIGGLDLTQTQALLNNYPGKSFMEREAG